MDDSHSTPDGLRDRVLGDFVLRERLGEGGFGAVYRAEQPRLSREAVVKVLRARHVHNAEARERFVREARLAGRFEHPFAAHLYDSNAEPDGTLWIAMELVRGVPLDAWLRERGPIPFARFVPFFERICEVVQAAHERGIVHRDLKPANVMVVETAGRLSPKLLDFGLAKLGDELGAQEADARPEGGLGAGLAPHGPQGQLIAAPAVQEPPALIEPVALSTGPISFSTEAHTPDAGAHTQELWQGSRLGRALGTPAYLAPEAWLDTGAAGPPADLYALGVLAWEALSGKPPFTGDVDTLARAHRDALLPPLPPSLPESLGPFFARALAKDPRARFTSATALGQALRESVSPRRTRLRAALGAVALVIALAAASWWRWEHSLPSSGRSVAIEVAPGGAQDAWFTTALEHLTRRELWRRSARFSLASDAREATVSLRLSSARDAQGVQLSASLSRPGARGLPLPGQRAQSIEDALGPLLDAAGAALSESQPERAPDAHERALLSATGARSLTQLFEYDRAMSAGLEAVFNDGPESVRLAEALGAQDPGWAHAYAMLALAQYQGSSAAQATIARASARLEPGRDPGGELLLRALADNDTARQFALLSASTQEQRLDPLFQWVLGSAAHGSRHEADAEAAFRQVNRMRPDLQAGSDLFNLLSLAGRPDEAKTFARQWAADNPDGEEAQLTWARVAVLEHRAADVDAALERLLLVHGEKLHRLVPICRLSIEVGNLARTRRLAERLLSGDVLEQNMGRYFLGETDVLAGRLNQARESFQTAYDLGHTQGTAGNAVQALEEQRSIAEVLGDQEALQRVDTLRIEQFTRLGLREMVAYATFERALAQRGSGPCPQIAPVLESLSTGPVHVMLEMLLVRAAAVAGCRPCADAVRLGQGSAELEQRSLFHLAQCAEQTGDLALAERTYARVTWVGAGSGTYGATAHGVLALWRRSRLLAKLGRADESLALAREFLQRWSQTDRPVPGVDEARAALRSR